MDTLLNKFAISVKSFNHNFSVCFVGRQREGIFAADSL